MRKFSEKNYKFAIPGSEHAIGRLVLSTAGRDSGKYMVVVGVPDDEHLLIADGKLRTLLRPKKKKLKHVSVMQERLLGIAERMAAGEQVLDAELRKFVAAYESSRNDSIQGGY